MTVYLFSDEEGLHLTADMSDEKFGIHGNLKRTLQSGDDFYGYTFDQLKALGNGGHELKVPIPTTKQAS